MYTSRAVQEQGGGYQIETATSFWQDGVRGGFRGSRGRNGQTLGGFGVFDALRVLKPLQAQVERFGMNKRQLFLNLWLYPGFKAYTLRSPTP